MANTTGFREIGLCVDNFLFKNKLTNDDYFMYLVHACDAYREISLRHSNAVVTAKVTISALGIIDMPTDMVGFSNLFIPIAGQFWSFTDLPRKVTTTTFTGQVEGQDAEQGEGVDVKDELFYGLGGVGGVNDYGRKIDWKARRIFCDGIKSDSAVLVYTSNGLEVGASTYVPSQCEETLDRYLLWKKAEVNNEPMNKVVYNEEKWKDAVLKLRVFNFLPNKDEIEDAWNKATTQSYQR